MTDNFVFDEAIREIAEAYALDAADIALRNMGITLDWSEASIVLVEYILDCLQKSARIQKPSPATVETFAKAFGSYIGEVFIRHQGGSWGMIGLAGQTVPGIRATRDGHLFWPWVRARNRLREGPEENVLHYYLRLAGQLKAPKFGPNLKSPAD